jgi:hypothetical protein
MLCRDIGKAKKVEKVQVTSDVFVVSAASGVARWMDWGLILVQRPLSIDNNCGARFTDAQTETTKPLATNSRSREDRDRATYPASLHRSVVVAVREELDRVKGK